MQKMRITTQVIFLNFQCFFSEELLQKCMEYVQKYFLFQLLRSRAGCPLQSAQFLDLSGLEIGKFTFAQHQTLVSAKFDFPFFDISSSKFGEGAVIRDRSEYVLSQLANLRFGPGGTKKSSTSQSDPRKTIFTAKNLHKYT